MTLKPVVRANDSRTRCSVFDGEICYLFFGNSADGGRARGRELAYSRAQSIKADCMPLYVVRVLQTAAGDHVHHRQSQRGVGSGPNLNMLVAMIHRVSSVGIDADYASAFFFRLLDLRPEVNIGAQRIRPPEHDEPGPREVLGVSAVHAAKGVSYRFRTGGRTYRERKPARAQAVEEAPIHARSVHDAERSAGSERKYGFRTFFRFGKSLEALGDFVESLIPAYSLEAAFAFRPYSAHRIEQAIGVVHSFEISRHLRTQKPLGRRMTGIARHADSAPIFNLDQHRAGIRAVVRAGGANRLLLSHSVTSSDC